jgi:hypothetical protein
LVFVTAELLAGENLSSQIETGVLCVALFEMGYEVEGELIVREAPFVSERLIERIFTAVAVGWVTYIV